MLDVKRLRILREVAEQGSFSAAGDALFLSQSAVSQQIATLEREVGMQLLDRTREGPKLTDAGRVLRRPCRGGDRPARGGRARAGRDRRARGRRAAARELPERQRDDPHRGRFDLPPPPPGGPPGGHRRRARGLAAAAAGRRARPGADLRLHVGPGRGGARPRPRRCCSPSRCIRAAEGSPARRADDRAARRARRCRLAVRLAPEHLRRGRYRRLPHAGFEPRIGFETDDYNVMQGFIAAGLGVTLLPDLALPTLREDLVVRPTDPPAPERRVWAATRPSGSRSPATEEMLSILAEVGRPRSQRANRERLSSPPRLQSGRPAGRWSIGRLGDRACQCGSTACGST